MAESIKTTIDNFIEKRQIAAPTEARYPPVWEPEQEPLTLDYREAASERSSGASGTGSISSDRRAVVQAGPPPHPISSTGVSDTQHRQRHP